MGFQPGTRRTRRSAAREYTRPLREKRKGGEGGRSVGRAKAEPTPVPTAKEVTAVTLKRLHTLGSQKFGSSPFGQHFERWLTDVKVVLSEFESNPNIGVDEEFLAECAQVVSTIERQLQGRSRVEAALDQEEKNLMESKNRLDQIKREYLSAATEIGKQRSREVKRLRRSIDRLKTDQDEVIRMKTGFFRGVSKKERERREIEVTQKLMEEQNALEVAMLSFKESKEKLRDEYDKKSTPVFVEIRKFQKKLDDGEKDDSLEDRWFACEALIDAVNNFLLRKNERDTQPSPPKN